jgi:hypothetical protein
VLYPFYFFGKTLKFGTQKMQSGVPQIADYYLMGVMLLVLLTMPWRLPRLAKSVVGTLVAFVIYGAFVNLGWATHLDDMSVLKSSVYYIYDLFLFVTCMLLYERYKDDFLKVTVGAVAASVLLQALLSPVAMQQGLSRQALFFNDENQLGYFSLLAATIFALGHRRFHFSASYRAVFYTAVVYLVVLSQCRAALLGFSALAVVALLERPLQLLAMLGFLTAAFFVITYQPALLGKSEERLAQSGRYDSVDARGNDRIFNYPEHIVVGAGEGAYRRFYSANFASEIHNTFGTLLFCYGIIGTVLFAAALFLMVMRDLRLGLFLIPPFIYGFAHHGLRSAFFWPMLAVFCCMALYPRLVPAKDLQTPPGALEPIL